LTFVFEANTSKANIQAEVTSGKFALANVTGLIYKDDVAFPNATDRGKTAYDNIPDREMCELFNTIRELLMVFKCSQRVG